MNKSRQLYQMKSSFAVIPEYSLTMLGQFTSDLRSYLKLRPNSCKSMMNNLIFTLQISP